MKKIGICYHPKLREAPQVAERLREAIVPHGEEVWVASAWDEEATRGHAEDTDLVICIGGDGTVLRAARAIVPHDVFLLGVNMGRLGFLTELDESEALDRLPDILGGKARIEERAILHADLLSARGESAPMECTHFHALNDVVLGRASLGRTVQVSVFVDGFRIADYRADGVVVATATGSTAYALSTGGPILHPESREIVLTPVSPHLVPRNAMVLPPSSEIELRLAPGQSAVLSIDGESDMAISPEVIVRVTDSDHLARFLRLSHTVDFYTRAARRLNWLREEEEGALPNEDWPGEEGSPSG
jgi:NAD+ kinase